MVDEHLQSDSDTGHLMFNPDNGHLAKACFDCVFCDAGTTPNQIVLTLSGILTCGCIGKKEYSISLPATVTLTRAAPDGGPCTWWGIGGTLTRELWTEDGCAGEIDDTKSADVYWTADKRDAASWQVYAGAIILLSEKRMIFWDDHAETDCSASATFTNEFAVGDCGNALPSPWGSYLVAGYDGTATK